MGRPIRCKFTILTSNTQTPNSNVDLGGKLALTWMLTFSTSRYTAVVAMTPLETLVHPGYAQESHVEETIVEFDKTVTDDLLAAYVRTREGADKAGGYAIQGTGSILVKRIDGTFDNVVGMPLRGTLMVIEKALSNDELDEEVDE